MAEVALLGVHEDRARLHRHFLAAERLDDDDAEPGQGDDDDVKDRDAGGQARGTAHLGPRDPGKALPPAPDRGGQDHHVLHRPRQADADDQPDQAGQVAKLDRQDRPDQGARAGDRREVVPEEDPAVGRVEVLAVVVLVRRGDPGVVERRHARREERAVIAVGHGQDGQDAEHHPHGMNGHRGRYLLEPAGESAAPATAQCCEAETDPSEPLQSTRPRGLSPLPPPGP